MRAGSNQDAAVSNAFAVLMASAAAGAGAGSKRQGVSTASASKCQRTGSTASAAAAPAAMSRQRSTQHMSLPQNSIPSTAGTQTLEQEVHYAIGSPSQPAPQLADQAAQQQQEQQTQQQQAQQCAEEGRASEQQQEEQQAALAAFRRAFSFRNQPRGTPQAFQYLAVYDLEATCSRSRSLQPVEIIELSCVVIETRSMQLVGEFQTYVRPTEHPTLDPFCLELTGIQQAQVDAAPLLGEALQVHHAWLEQRGLLQEGVVWAPVTWTSWDFKIALATECTWRRITPPAYLRRWIDLKRFWARKYSHSGNLRSCVEAAGLVWEGRAHSGLDDSRNTARLAVALMTKKGLRLSITEQHEDYGSATAAAAAAAAGVACGPSASGAGSGSGERGRGDGAAGRLALQRSSSAANTSSNIHQQQQQQVIALKKAVVIIDSDGRWNGMCKCGVPAQLRTTKRPGANHGRQFYSCGLWTITAQSRKCEHFMWVSDVPPGSSLPASSNSGSGRRRRKGS